MLCRDKAKLASMDSSNGSVVVDQGKRQVEFAAWLLLLVSLASIGLYLPGLNAQPIAVYILLFTLAVPLALGLFRAHPLARWLTVALVAYEMVLLVPGFAELYLSRQPRVAIPLVYLTFYLAHSFIACQLLFAPSVRAFFRAERARRVAARTRR